jgi:hypothetical protein
MFRKCLMVVRGVEDAKFLLKILQALGFDGAIILTALDIAYLPTSKLVVSLPHTEWINDCLSIIQQYSTNIETRIIKYDGNTTPAELLTRLAKEESCDFITVARRNPTQSTGKNLVSSLADLSPVPVMVIPYGGI